MLLKVHKRNLAHRLSLYVFFYDSKHLPTGINDVNLREPLRVVIITNPRKFVHRIYYNQASSSNDGTLKLVNWFDGNKFGLFAQPILSRVKNIYDDFHGRSFIVPVVHVSKQQQHQQKLKLVTQSINQKHEYQHNFQFQSPPWIFINYIENNSTDSFIDQSRMYESDTDSETFTASGRDDSLLKILAEKMNFKFKYVDVARVYSADNNTRLGELSLRMLKERV